MENCDQDGDMNADCIATGVNGKDSKIVIRTEQSVDVPVGNIEEKNENDEKHQATVVDGQAGRNNEKSSDRDEGPTVPDETQPSEKTAVFKKPALLIGPRRGKTVGKIKAFTPTTNEAKTTCILSEEAKQEDNTRIINSLPVETLDEKKFAGISPAEKAEENSIPLPYKEPKWSGITDQDYSFEVEKNGKIIETIDLTNKPFYVIGRLSSCDIQMAHPTVSRYHCILQYRKEGNEQNPVGFYIYDLGSTHGTFLNKYRIKQNMYVRIQVGHMLKFGNSTRVFILMGPESDQEKESELSVTELREKRKAEKEQKEYEKLMREQEEKKRLEQEEEEGIDWGMGEDADEETDLSENPFAATQNEELYIDDPKKTLRGWFEREGYDLEYNVEEKGYSQFLCSVELPIGNGMKAEAFVKGKKKEAVVQCALEACRILDRYGMLRQATHESRKRKAKNWEDDDFYDSDEDTFLDRTGVVEKKRQQRMKAAGKLEQETETYESLLKKHSELLLRIKEIESDYHKASQKLLAVGSNDANDEDALDAFMSQLSSGIVDKKLVSSLKTQLQALLAEEEQLRGLVNIARPATLPELLPATAQQSGSHGSNKAALITAVKRKVAAAQMSKISQGKMIEDDVEEEEEEEEEVEYDSTAKEENISQSHSIPTSTKTVEVAKHIKPEVLEGTGNNNDLKQTTPDLAQENIGSLDNTGSSSGLETHSQSYHKKIIGPTLPPGLGSVNEEEKTASEKNKKRSRRRETKNAKKKQEDKIKGDYDQSNPDYSVWVPPEGQSGDGRTKLNDKFGY